jgi:hypothetical protein
MISPVPIAAYMRRGMDMYDPRISLHDRNVLDEHANILTKLVKNDHGLDTHQKKQLTTILNTPEYVDHILAGLTGRLLAQTIFHYNNLPRPAQTLLSLAGYGIGNIIYNHLHEDKFSHYNSSTGTSKINL